MKYSVISKDDIFAKEDNNQCLVMIKSKAYQFVLNNTGKMILERIRDFDNSGDLILDFQNQYPNEDKRVLERDFLEILRLFDVYGVIKLESKTDLPTDGVLKYKFVGEKSYSAISDFVIDEAWDNPIKICNTDNIGYYKPYFIRQRTFFNKEYGIYVENDGIIEAYLTFVLPGNLSNVIIINSLFFKNKIDEDEISKYFIGILNRIITKIQSQNNMKKIRLSLIEGCDKKIINCLIACGFVIECELLNECYVGNVIFYTLFL